VIGIDEIAIRKGHTYRIVVSDLLRGQAEVFAACVAYNDNEIGRVIQEVVDQGKLDNTLIIYISGDNGTSAEGSTIGTPFDLAAIQGIVVPVEEQMKFYDVQAHLTATRQTSLPSPTPSRQRWTLLRAVEKG
jgi:arylsulfatase A-like enzyme